MGKKSPVTDQQIECLLKKGYSWLAIQRELHVSPVRIARIVKNNHEYKRNNLSPYKSKISPGQVEKIYRYLKSAKRSGAEWNAIFTLLEEWMDEFKEVLKND